MFRGLFHMPSLSGRAESRAAGFGVGRSASDRVRLAGGPTPKSSSPILTLPEKEGGRRADAGFTLIEVMAAMGVFSLAALSLMHVGAENARSASRLEETTFARILADNVMIAAVTAEGRAEIGTETGETEMADMRWRWRRTIAETPQADILRIDVSVRPADAQRDAANLTGFMDR